MSDFDELRQMREAKEKAESLARQKALEEERRRAEAAQKLVDREGSYASKLNDTVIEVLEALKDAVYPGCKVQGWGIGTTHEDWETGEHFYHRVKVELEFDKGGEPRRFCIHRGQLYSSDYKSVKCGLTRDELIRALRRLHPPRVVSKVRKC